MLDKMLEYIRIALYTLLVLIGFFFYQAWEKEHTKPETEVTKTVAASRDRFVPTDHVADSAAPEPVATAQSTVPSVATTSGQLVKVTTDVLNVSIDTHGGDIVEVNLLKYPESLGSKAPFQLLTDDGKTRYIAESGLLGKEGPDTVSGQALYTAEQMNYSLQPGENSLVVKLNWKKDGVDVTKTLTFVRDSYEIKTGYEINNQSGKAWDGSFYTQLARKNTPPATHGGFVNLTTYFGAAISTPQKPFEKITFKEMQKQEVSREVKDGWVAMIQHYFVSAWVPPKTAVSNYYSRVTPSGLYTIGMIGSPLHVAPGAKAATEADLYVCPAIADRLEKAAPGLQLTIDYGWFWFISIAIFWMMQKIYDFLGNWGWSIVIVTIIIKLLFYQLSNKSYRSMSAMKRLQPKIESLKERLGDDKQKMTQATLELYRKEKVNPMSGCLPILIQIPVFIALYWVLVESVQLRQAPFILWIHDLSTKDPYYILPVLMGLSMFLQQRLNPPPPDPIQAKVMMAMPLVFALLFANFPAGLMLYWVVNNTLSFLQQWHIMHRVEKEANVKRSK